MAEPVVVLTMTEMVQAAGRLRQAVEVPVIADADTGYGNALNVIRTVREYEAAGVAAIHLEGRRVVRWKASTRRSTGPAATATPVRTCCSSKHCGPKPRSNGWRTSSAACRCCSTGPKAGRPRRWAGTGCGSWGSG